MNHKLLLRVALSCAMFASCSRAQAEPSAALLPVGLTWTRGEDADACISQAELREAVDHHLSGAARILDVSSPKGVRVAGSVRRGGAPGHWVASLSLEHGMHGPQGARTIEVMNPDCRELDEALVLVVALMIQPWLRHAPDQSQTAPESEVVSPVPEARPEATPPPAPPSRASSDTSSSSRIEERASLARGTTAVGVLVATGLFPAPAWGLTAGVGFRPNAHFGVELAGALFPHGSANVDAGGVEFLAGYATLRSCVVPFLTRIVFDLCVGGSLGRIRARATGGAMGAPDARRLLGNVEVSLRGTLQLRRGAFLRVSSTLAAPIPRDRFVFQVEDQIIPLHRMKAVLSLVALEVGWLSR